MKILLLGEYSNVHATLAKGLRALGHEVTVASNGDFWKNYPRDIDLARNQSRGLLGKLDGIRLFLRVLTLLPKWRGYDVVQLINPMFLELKAERILPIYKYLRRHNKKIVLCAFGMDYYWVNECVTRMPLRYSDFNIGEELRTDEEALKERRDWIGTAKEDLNKYIAQNCDAIVTGLYEYHVCYEPHFPQKTKFIPFPIESGESLSPALPSREGVWAESQESREPLPSPPLKGGSLSGEAKVPTVFVGVSKGRSAYKGTDIMLKAAEDIKAKYPDRMKLEVASGVPFSEYSTMLNRADIILDQLYSYTPAMNALEAMARGTIVVGGGEQENYIILGEDELRPIVNVLPTYDSVYHELEQLVTHPERIAQLKRQSIEYIHKHHDFISVAKQYIDLYSEPNI